MSSDAKRLNRGFWQIADPKIWVGSIVPMCFAAVFAWAVSDIFDILWFMLACAGIFLIEIGKNAVNEVFDYLSGADPDVDAEHLTARA